MSVYLVYKKEFDNLSLADILSTAYSNSLLYDENYPDLFIKEQIIKNLSDALLKIKGCKHVE